MRRARGAIMLLAVVVIAGAVFWLTRSRPASTPPIGMVRATEIRIQPEVSGRVAAIRVKVGDVVHAGDVLVQLDNPELVAALGEARAAIGEARAARDQVYAGPRREQVDILASEVQKAQSDLTLAEQHFSRISTLASSDNATREDRDKAAAEVGVAQSALATARSNYAEAAAGPTAEDRATADANVALAEASAAVVARRVDKTVLTAPVNGVVSVVAAEPGEAIAPGRTLLTLEASDEPWFSFVLREDRLAGVAIGAKVALVTADGKALDARISEILELGEFATWRAARAVGDHDLNSFAVRADPVGEHVPLAPGMTVWLTPPAR